MDSQEKKTILLVDDETLIAMDEAQTIRNFGYEVLIANSGEKAVELALSNEAVCLSLMDINLGRGIDGPMAAQQILEKRNIPIVFLTSHSEEEYVDRVKKITRYGYVIKNSGDFVLRSSIEMAFELWEANRKIQAKMDELEQSETFIKTVMDNLPIGIMVNVVDPVVANYINDNFVKFYRTTREAVADPDAFWKAAYEDEDFREEIKKKVLDDCASGDPARMFWKNVPITRKGEKTTYVDAMNIPIPDKKSMISLVWEVTERKMTEDNEKERNRFIETLVDLNPDNIYIYDLVEKTNVYSNNGIGRILGYTPEEIKKFGNTVIQDLMHPDDFGSYVKNIISKYSQASDDDVIRHTYRMMHKNGEWHWLESSERIYKRLPDGSPRQIFGVIHDITELRKMEVQLAERQRILETTTNSLRENENKLNRIISNSSELICEVNELGIYTFISDSYEKVLGYKPEELIGKPAAELIHPEDLKAAVTKHRTIRSNIASSIDEWRFRDKGGIFHTFECRGSVYVSQSGKPMTVVISHDITERRQMEDDLKASEERCRFALEGANDGLWDVNMITNEVYISPRGCEILEYKPEEMQEVAKVWNDLVNPEDLPLTNEHLSDYLKGKSSIFEVEQRLRTKSGKWKWVLTRGKASQWDKNGAVSRMTGTHTDITARKRSDNKIKSLIEEKELILKEVHHRIKNNMNTVSSLLSIQARASKEPAIVEALEEARGRIQSMMVLYDKLYLSADFEKISAKDYISVLVDRIIENYPHHGSVKAEKNIADFILDSKQLSHLGIIINELITNCMKYAFTGGIEGKIIVNAAVDNSHVSLSIQDNGCGIPESIDFRKSTGFGLTLVEMLAQQMDGVIRIERDKGTRIILEFEK